MAVSLHINVLSFWQSLWCAETDVETQNNSGDDIFLFAATGTFMRRDISRINDYFEVTVPRYQPDVFPSHFHMTRRTFELLVHMIGPSEHIPKGNSFGRPVLDPRKQIAMSLWMMANQETHRQIADRFDSSLSSVSRCFRRVCKALVDLLPDLVKWPNAFRGVSRSKMALKRSVAFQE
ncbi:PREDICTED: uncharacterized protein LOC107329251 [Acropora digitifera]|uniref:uncharacterized protein LOC107329251 n=1 Tax=Acropora digitifera TaxID=70779 RepID=UPI00077A1C8F|nr:PREDICTED: uncharacterized protein LOC107329251 [Acropora digitifera]